MNIVKTDQNYELYFERLFARSSAQNSVCLVMTTVAEIVVKGCSCVFIKLLTTGKRDSYVTMAAVDYS